MGAYVRLARPFTLLPPLLGIVSGAVCAFCMMRITRTNNNANITNAPTNPCSSANAEKMKSLCGTGRHRSWVCVPFVTPVPYIPPDPTAISEGLN